MPYGITEAGRQWATVFEGGLLKDAGFETVFRVSKIFTKRDKNGGIVMMTVKVTDDLVKTGSLDIMKTFVGILGTRFPISKEMCMSLYS